MEKHLRVVRVQKSVLTSSERQRLLRQHSLPTITADDRQDQNGNVPTNSVSTTKTANATQNHKTMTEPKWKQSGTLKWTPREQEFDWLHWVYKNWKDTQPGELDDALLSQMVAAIPRWARRKSPEAAQRAEQLLERSILEAETEARSSSSFLTVASFNAAMDAFGKIGQPEGVQRILRRMEGLRRSRTNDDSIDLTRLRPDEFSMSILATAWAKSRSPKAADQVEAILRYMDLKKMRINTTVYNAVLHAIAVSCNADKALQAEDIVKRMKEREEEGGDCRPDVYTYQSLIQAWAYTPLAGAPQRCEQILRRMDEEANNGGNAAISPNAYCFTSKFHLSGLFVSLASNFHHFFFLLRSSSSFR